MSTPDDLEELLERMERLKEERERETDVSPEVREKVERLEMARLWMQTAQIGGQRRKR